MSFPYAYSYPHSAWRLYYQAGYRCEQGGLRHWDAYISVFFLGGLWVSLATELKMVGKGSQQSVVGGITTLWAFGAVVRSDLATRGD